MNDVLEQASAIFAPKTPEEADRRARVRNVRERIKCGDRCARCDREFGGGPVYRVDIGIGYGLMGWMSAIAPLCAECGSRCGPFFPPRPCETCGKPVYDERRKGYRRHSLCSTKCGRKHYRAMRTEKRRAAIHAVECRECGKEFTPPRKDTKFCSPACKQRAYRKRKDQ